MQISMQMRLAELRIQTGKWVLWGKEAAASGKHAGQGLSLPAAQHCALRE